MLKTVSIDGPDFSGKSTLCKMVKGMLESAGLKVCIRNHPTTETEAGIRARSLVIQSAAKAKIAEAMCDDFLHTLDHVVDDYDVVIFDRFCPSTVVYQGVDGKDEVFRRKLTRHFHAPDLYVWTDVDYDGAVARFKKRVEEQGKNWDDEVLTVKYLKDSQSWEALRGHYRFAHHILTEGGCLHHLLPVKQDDDYRLKAAEIVACILEN